MTLEEFELAMNRIEDDMAWDYRELGRIGIMCSKFSLKIGIQCRHVFQEIMSPRVEDGNAWLGYEGEQNHPDEEASANRLNAFYFFEQICLEYELYREW